MLTPKTIDLKNDIFFSEEYLNAVVELYNNAELMIFEYKEKDKIFKNIGVKKPIPAAKKLLGKQYFDMETPYGFGGIYTNTDDYDFLKRAWENFKDDCVKNNIIAEFIRFHPFDSRSMYHKSFLNTFKILRKTVFVNLTLGIDNIRSQYKSTLRYDIKKALRYDVGFFKADDIKSHLNSFIHMYYETMKRNNASNFYFFKKEFFDKLSKMKNVEIFYTRINKEIANYVITLASNNGLVYYYLSATRNEFLKYNVNHFLLDQIINYYSEKRYKIFYLGGGKPGSTDEEDSLFKFKCKFSRNFANYIIGGKIFIHPIYEKLVDLYKKHGKRNERFLPWS